MSKWKDRKNTIDAESDYDPLISIPMLEHGDKSRAMKALTNAFDTDNSKNIVIIDPYLLDRDIDVILSLFATQAGRNITVITFLNRVNDDDQKTPTKIASATTISSISEELNRKGIFDSFQVIVTKFDFHDRYFFCTDEDKDGILVASGGSLGMLFNKYSGLIRITNRTFRRTLLQFIELSKSNGRSLSEYIQEHS